MLVSNTTMTSLYGAQFFVESPPCLAQDGGNITIWFDISFIVGFTLNAVNLLFFACFEPTNRQTIGSDTEKSDLQKILQQTGIVLEWLLRMVIYVASAL